jgi:hypothetical protein
LKKVQNLQGLQHLNLQLKIINHLTLPPSTKMQLMPSTENHATTLAYWFNKVTPLALSNLSKS